MWVADVPMPSVSITFRPSVFTSSYPGASMRFVAMNCGEIQRVRIASSTFG